MTTPTTKTLTPAQYQSLSTVIKDLVLDLLDCIKMETESSPLGGVPSGHLYARFSGHISLETWNQIVSLLVATGRVKQSNYLLSYVAPTK